MVDKDHARLNGFIEAPEGVDHAWAALVPTDYARSISGEMPEHSILVLTDGAGNIVDIKGNPYVDLPAPSPGIQPLGDWTYRVLLYLPSSGYQEFTISVIPGAMMDFSDLHKIGGGLGASGTGDIDVSNYVTKSMLSNYALATAIPDVSGLVSKTTADSKYAAKSDIPDVSGLASKSDIPDVSGLVSKTTADSKYASKSDIPDVSGLVSKTTADSKYAAKSDIPDVSNFATKAELASYSAGTPSFTMDMLVLGKGEGVPAGTYDGTIIVQETE